MNCYNTIVVSYHHCYYHCQAAAAVTVIITEIISSKVKNISFSSHYEFSTYNKIHTAYLLLLPHSKIALLHSCTFHNKVH